MQKIYVVQCFKLFLGILDCNFFFFTCNFFLQFFQVLHKILEWFKTHGIKLLQYSSIVFDLHNKELCDGLGRKSRLTTLCIVEQNFSMLGKLLAKNRHFPQSNVCKYLALYVNKSLSIKIMCINATFVTSKCNFVKFFCATKTFPTDKDKFDSI